MNGPEEDLPEAPGPTGAEDLSVFDDDPPAGGYSIGSDDQALKQISRRTTPFGRIVAVLLLVGAGVVGYLMYRANVSSASRMDGVEACGAMPEEAQLLSCLRAELGTAGFDDVKERIIRNLGHFRDAESVPALIEALDEAGAVRRAAALALAQIGLPAAEPAKAKLLQVLGDTDDKDWAAVVWALTVLRESQASDHIIRAFADGRLQEMEGFSPRLITEVLGPGRLSSDDLLNHESEGVRMLTAQALAEVGSSEVVDPLSRLLAAESARPESSRSQEVMREAAAGLGRTADPRAAQPLFNLMNDLPNMRSSVIDALRKTTGAPALAVLVDQTNDVNLKREIVRLLAATHDARGADKLAELTVNDDLEIRSASAVALADLGDRRAVTALVAIAGGEDEGAADAALDALRRLRSPEAAAGIAAMLPTRCPDEPTPEMEPGCFRQAALLAALGACGNEQYGRRLMDALTGVDTPAASMALAAMNYEPGFETVLRMVERPRDIDMGATNAAERTIPNEDLLRSRKGAILAMGRYGRPEAAEALFTVIEDLKDDYELRALAAASLGMVATPEMLQQVIAKIRDTGTEEASRRYYVQALWQKPQRELNGALLDLIASDAPTEVRRAAALAVGYSADPEVEGRVVEMLADESTRKEAAFAIVLGGSADAAARLVEALTQDTDTDEVLQYGLGSEDHDWFNLLTESMFESGEIWRRIEVGLILQAGTRNRRWGLPYMKVVTVLKSGWDGVNGVDARGARDRLWEALTGDDAARRRLAAKVLADMGERGLLIRGRDQDGNGREEATRALDEMNRPTDS